MLSANWQDQIQSVGARAVILGTGIAASFGALLDYLPAVSAFLASTGAFILSCTSAWVSWKRSVREDERQKRVLALFDAKQRADQSLIERDTPAIRRIQEAIWDKHTGKPRSISLQEVSAALDELDKLDK